MTKEQVTSLRKELAHLPGDDRNQRLPIRIFGSNTDLAVSEADACFLWDDDAEVVYIVAHNTTYTQTCDERLFPMSIMVIPYSEITLMSVPVDRLSLDHFLESKVGTLTDQKTRERYFRDITALYDERTYFMGDPSPTTSKRGLNPDDEIVDTNATKFL